MRISRSAWPVIVLLLLAACGGRPDDVAEVDAADSAAPASVIQVVPPPEPPEYPTVRGGFLAVRSAGEVLVEGEWRATVGSCDEPSLFQVTVNEPAIGVLALVQPAPDGETLGSYPIRSVENALPAAPGAQIGVHSLEQSDPVALVAVSGQVELTEVGTRVSGRAAVVMMEITSQRRTGLALAFLGLPLAPLSDEECALAAPPPDSAAVG